MYILSPLFIGKPLLQKRISFIEIKKALFKGGYSLRKEFAPSGPNLEREASAFRS